MADPDRTKWEYMQLTVRPSAWSFSVKDRDKVVADLNGLGREGWELAASYQYVGNTQYYMLKRPVREPI